MNQLKGCKKKEKQTISSKLSNLRLSKRKSALKKIPDACSLKDKFPSVWLQPLYGNCTSYACLACDSYYYHTDKFMPSTTFCYYNQKRNEKPLLDDGSYNEKALRVIKKFGTCNSSIWANDEPFDQKPSDFAYQDGLHGHEVKKWYAVTNLKQLKQALASGYPVVAAFDWAFDKGYDNNYILYHPTSKEVFDNDNGHAVVIVGYDNKTGLVEIRNSWGEGWGNNGYCYMKYETLKRCIWWDDTYAVVK